MKREELEKYILQTHDIITSYMHPGETLQRSPGASASAVCEAPAGYGTAQKSDDVQKLLRQMPSGNYTIEDYEQIPDERRVELIDGVIYDMSAPTTLHQQIAGEVYFQLKQYFRGGKGPCVPFISPVDVELGKDKKTILQPDVLIVCGKNKIGQKRIYGAPDWILEVISPSTSQKDYIIKTVKYMTENVREYWLIDPKIKKVIVYNLERDEGPQIHDLKGKLPTGIYQGDLTIDLDEITQLF